MVETLSVTRTVSAQPIPATKDNEMLTVITLTDKPEMGNRERVCKGCQEWYRGWNFALCPSCERYRNRFAIVRAW
jgi:hypothetical protein